MDNMHTYTEYTFPNGEKIKCTVAFRFLPKLREENKRIYTKLNHALINGVEELLETAYILYGSYLCACYAGENGGAEKIMSEADFMEALDDDLISVMQTCNSFLNKKKN